MSDTTGKEQNASEPEGKMPEIDLGPVPPSPPPISLCKCILGSESQEEVIVSERKKLILSTVSRTENYLRERRIPELLRFLLTKLLAYRGKTPIAYAEQLINDCMLYRAGFGQAPVVYEDRHLEAVVKSFDPGQRGWLSAGQVRRAFKTLGLTLKDDLEERIPTDEVLKGLKVAQEEELYELLNAGITRKKHSKYTSSISSKDSK
ncbi:unnamed protein product [Chrysodeixis includens]|uniref:EF-hand domain-containing protein n=1 Tax=Chrysodeixis includens TaxID=689277 RepID=A0A9P0BTE1_CHRIL|nr:unnamed protein product [Chrysodeixis includens]